jgi:hypothetical protein
MWVLPWLGFKLQPPELVLVALCAAGVVVWVKSDKRPTLIPIDAVAGAWLAANVWALVWSAEPRTRDGAIETIGAASLVALYAAVRLTATARLLDRFGEWFGYSAALAATIGLVGSVTADAGLPNRLATDALTPIPYLGHAARAQAFTAGPQMLASILLVAVPLFIANRMKQGWRPRDRALLLLLLLGLAATVSKTALCLAAALAVMWACVDRPPWVRSARSNWRRASAAVVVWVAVAVVFGLGSHILVLRETAIPSMTSAELVAGSPLASFRWRDQTWAVMPTTYFFNKLASLQAIGRSWPIGVGPAGQPAFTERLQREGRFPTTIWLITPHSTYLGAVAQLGATGLTALLLMLITGGWMIRRLLTSSAMPRWDAAACAGVGAAFLIEAVSTDLLNCRHYWLLFAVMAARFDTRE